LNVRAIKIEYIVIFILYFCIALFIFFDVDNVLFAVENTFIQIIILTALSYAVSNFFLAIEHPIVIFILTIIDTLLILLILRIHVTSFGLRLWISAVLFYLYSVKFNYKISLMLSVLAYLMVLYLQNSASLFGFVFNKMATSELWLLAMTQLLFLFFAQLLQFLIRKTRACKEENLIKENSIINLTDTNLGFQEFAMKIENQSRMEERLSITREVHDITGYTLTSIMMMLEYAEDLFRDHNEQDLIDLLKTARNQARNGHNEIRMALKHLRSIKDVTIPFFNRIQELLGNFTKVTGMDIKLELTNLTSTVSPQNEQFIFRFLQEGLTNAYRHGKATSVQVIFFQETDNMVISMGDNGVGSSKINEGIGLKGMSERIREQGGTIHYHSLKTGFNLIARLPLKRIKDE
jgi:signal transduction histidine kinase